MSVSNFYTTTLIINHLAERARDLGVNPDQLIVRVGLEHNVVTDPFNWAPTDQMLALLNGLIDLSGEQDFAFRLGSTPFHPSHWGIPGYALVSAPNLDTSLELALDLMNGRDGDSFVMHGISWQEATGSFFMRPNTHHLPVMDDYQEYWLAQTLQYICNYFGKPRTPIEVSFAHSPKGPLKKYEKFYKCPVRFNQPVTAFSFPADWRDSPGANSDTLMFQTMIKFSQAYIEAINPEAHFTSRVKYQLETNMRLSNPLTLGVVAENLQDSPRNIQRNLKGEGTTFSEILDDVKKNNAVIYLKNSPKSLEEISYLLGFSNHSAFHHAFKRWTGLTPKEFRERYVSGTMAEYPYAPGNRAISR